MASTFPDTGTDAEVKLQAVLAVLPELPPSQQRSIKVPLGLKDAETISGKDWKKQEQEKTCATKATTAAVYF